MFAKVAILALIAVTVSADRTNSYRPPSNQYQQPQPAPQPKPQNQYQQPIQNQYQQPSNQFQQRESYDRSDEHQEPAKYAFDWSVKDEYSGNDFGQEEERDGDSTKGSYYVLLPDGRTQTVTYYVDGDSGFVAEVTYEGEASYDQPTIQQYKQPEPAPRQQYQQPKPQPPPRQQYQQPPKQQYNGGF